MENRFRPHITTWFIFTAAVSFPCAVVVLLVQKNEPGLGAILGGIFFLFPFLWASYNKWLYLVLKIKIREHQIDLPFDVKVEIPGLVGNQNLQTDELIIENGVPTKFIFEDPKNYVIPLESIRAVWLETDIHGRKRVCIGTNSSFFYFSLRQVDMERFIQTLKMVIKNQVFKPTAKFETIHYHLNQKAFQQILDDSQGTYSVSVTTRYGTILSWLFGSAFISFGVFGIQEGLILSALSLGIGITAIIAGFRPAYQVEVSEIFAAVAVHGKRYQMLWDEVTEILDPGMSGIFLFGTGQRLRIPNLNAKNGWGEWDKDLIFLLKHIKFSKEINSRKREIPPPSWNKNTLLNKQ